MKIILFAWNRLGKRWKGNWNHEFFRRELARQHDVLLWGIGYEGYDSKLNVSDVLDKNPGTDVILTHFEHKEGALTPGLENIDNILKVHIMGGDYYKARDYRSYDPYLYQMNFDIIFSPISAIRRNLMEKGINSKHYLLFWAVNTDKYHNQNLEKTVDVTIASQTGHNHHHRPQMRQVVRNMKDITSSIHNIWFDEYIKQINQTRIFVTCNIQNQALHGKWSEVMACGTFLLATKSEDMERAGYIAGEHLIIYKDDFSDLEDKIRYFLKHDKEREEIATNGMKHVRENHSHITRVKEFTEIIEKELLCH